MLERKALPCFRKNARTTRSITTPWLIWNASLNGRIRYGSVPESPVIPKSALPPFFLTGCSHPRSPVFAFLYGNAKNKKKQVDDIIYDRIGAKTFTETVVGETTRPQYRILRYLAVPTVSKPEVDQTPYLTKGLEIPPFLLDEAAKALAKLRSRPASQDEVYAFLCENRGIRTYNELLDWVDARPGIAESRVSKYINNNICRAEDSVRLLIQRRNRAEAASELSKGPTWYLEEAVKKCGVCVCTGAPRSTTVEQDLDFLVNFHGLPAVQPFLHFAEKFFSQTLPRTGRPRNCFLVGVPSSGKSTLTDLVSQVIPSDRTFSMALDSTTPFCNLRSQHLLATCDDWRFTNKVPVTGTLQWLEGRPFAVDVKGKDPIQLAQGPPCLLSTNRTNESGSWEIVDIEAFRER